MVLQALIESGWPVVISTHGQLCFFWGGILTSLRVRAWPAHFYPLKNWFDLGALKTKKEKKDPGWKKNDPESKRKKRDR